MFNTRAVRVPAPKRPLFGSSDCEKSVSKQSIFVSRSEACFPALNKHAAHPNNHDEAHVGEFLVDEDATNEYFSKSVSI